MILTVSSCFSAANIGLTRNIRAMMLLGSARQRIDFIAYDFTRSCGAKIGFIIKTPGGEGAEVARDRRAKSIPAVIRPPCRSCLVIPHRNSHGQPSISCRLKPVEPAHWV